MRQRGRTLNAVLRSFVKKSWTGQHFRGGFLCLSLLLPWTGCVVQGAPGAADLAVECDGGGCADVVESCVDAGGACGQGPTVDLTPGNVIDACATLLTRTCGSDVGQGPGCPDSPSCTAAGLLRAYRPEDCVDALSDLVSYPACELDACQLLLDRVCGGRPASFNCENAPGCPPALELDARAHQTDGGPELRADALSSCSAALEDDVIFAACE